MADNTTPRPLNVTDALAYLDLIKNRFWERPEVYDQFLAIMREYKGQMYVFVPREVRSQDPVA